MSREIEKFSDYVEKALRKLSKTDTINLDLFTSELAQLINQFFNTYDYLGIVLEGPQGTRKTSIAMLILYKLYGSWDKVINSIYFNVGEFVNDSLNLLKKDLRVKARILDDFGFGEGSKWRPSSELSDLLEYMNIVRTMYGSLIFTYVDNSAARFVRDNASLKIITNRVTLNDIEVVVYKRKYSLMGPIWKRVLSFRFKKDEFSKIEGFDDAYKKYWELRRKYAIDKGERLREGMDHKKLLLFAAILGYYIGKLGYSFRDLLGILRDVMELRFKTKTATGVHSLVKRKLEEYNILEYKGNGKQS